MKFSLFIFVGMLSIYPTIQFLKLKSSNGKIEKIKRFKTIIFLIRVELLLLLIIPLVAILIAKGIGI